MLFYDNVIIFLLSNHLYQIPNSNNCNNEIKTRNFYSLDIFCLIYDLINSTTCYINHYNEIASTSFNYYMTCIDIQQGKMQPHSNDNSDYLVTK